MGTFVNYDIKGKQYTWKIKQGGTGKPLVQYTISVCIQKHIMVAGFSPVSGLYSFSPIIGYDFKDKYRCWVSKFYPTYNW